MPSIKKHWLCCQRAFFSSRLFRKEARKSFWLEKNKIRTIMQENMNRNEARQRAVVVNVPRDLGVEINVVDRQVTPQPTAPLIDASSFVVRRGGGHPLAPAPVDPLKDAREFVARK